MYLYVVMRLHACALRELLTRCNVSSSLLQFKGNNAGTKTSSKYISPYSLRHLAGSGSGTGS